MFFPKMSVQELSRSRRLLLLFEEQKRLKFGPGLYQTLKGPLLYDKNCISSSFHILRQLYHRLHSFVDVLYTVEDYITIAFMHFMFGK